MPEALKFIGPKEKTSIPLYLQFLFAHFGLDLVRMASIHTPSPFATALGLVGALLIGQIAVTVGFFTPEVLLYTGLVALGVFSSPSWELSMANRVFLFILILLTGLLRLPGLLIGIALILLRLLTTKSFGFPYLWPLIPLNLKVLFICSSGAPSRCSSTVPPGCAPRTAIGGDRGTFLLSPNYRLEVVGFSLILSLSPRGREGPGHPICSSNCNCLVCRSYCNPSLGARLHLLCQLAVKKHNPKILRFKWRGALLYGIIYKVHDFLGNILDGG